MALKQIAGRVAIKMPRLSGIRTCDCDQGPRNSKLERSTPSSRRSTALDGRPRRGAESSERHVVAPTGRWRAMPRASPQARLVGYSRFQSVRVALLVGRLPARCPDGYLGRANPDCMRRLRPCGRAIRRDLDRQPTRFGAERAVPKFRAKIAGPPASVYPEIGGCPRADLCAGSEDTDGPVGDPPAMFLKARPRSVRGRIPPGREARLGQRRR